MASQPSSIVNPGAQGRYSLHVSEELLDRENASATFATVKLNHKPSQTGARKAKITTSGPNSFALDITDREDGKTSAYHYGGQRKRSKKSYVLVFDPENTTCALKPLSEAYNFNLESTPWQPSAEILSTEYAQIQSESPSEHDDADPLESYSDTEIDENNPFDYRHHLNRSSNKSPSPSPGNHLAPPKTTIGLNNGPRDRSISAPEPPNRGRKAPPPKQRPTPAVRLERRASTRGVQKSSGKATTAKKGGTGPKSREFISVSDDEEASPKPTPAPSDIEEQEEDDYGDINSGGGLEIDFGNSPPHSKRQRALTLPGSAKGGPISLRSAANSPSSQIHTPHQQRDDADGLVINLGDTEEYVDDVAEMSDAEGDVDVEPISLGSPAHAKGDGHVNGVDQDVDMDDFEAEMMQGLASQDDDTVPFGHSRAQESESESEAE